MKINVKVVFVLISISSLLGLTYNYFSPSGINLIAEKKTIKPANDSLFNKIENDNNVSSELYKPYGSENHKEEQEVFSQKKKITRTNTSKNESKPETVFTEPVAINLKQAYSLYKQNILFIDAREPEDYKIAHIKNAISIPFDHFDDYENKLKEIDKKQSIVTYCAGTDCDLSILLGNLLFEMGYKRVYVFFGGWNEWLEANYPVVKEEKPE